MRFGSLLAPAAHLGEQVQTLLPALALLASRAFSLRFRASVCSKGKQQGALTQAGWGKTRGREVRQELGPAFKATSAALCKDHHALSRKAIAS